MDNKLLTHFFFGEKKSRNTGDDGEQFWDSFLHEGERQQDNTKKVSKYKQIWGMSSPHLHFGHLYQ